MERGTDGAETSTRVSRRWKRKAYRILRRLVKGIMLLSIVLLTLILSRTAFSFHEKQSTRSPELPRKFFPSHGLVIDYHFGNLQPVVKLLEDEELIFVFYYAPWNTEAINVRGEFLKAAKVLSNTVKFVAVNCWYPDGECRQRMKFLSNCELFVYHTGVQDGYRFIGMKEAEYFVKFVESFLNPLKPLHSAEQLREFISQQDNSVVGYFDFNSSPQPPGVAFHQFYLTALRVTSYEYLQPVRFGIVQNRVLANALDLHTPGRFVLMRAANATLKYPLFFNMTSKNMTSWIFAYKQKNISPWLVPPSLKSLTLSLPLQKGPAVLVFGPVNPLLDFNPYLNLVRTASYAYNSCGNNSVKYVDILRRNIQNIRTQLYNAQQIQKRCHTRTTEEAHRKQAPKFSDPMSRCCMSFLSGSQKITDKSVCEYCVPTSGKDRDAVCNVASQVKFDWEPAHVNSCSDSVKFYNANEYHSLCCHSDRNHKLPYSVLYSSERKPTDPFIINGASSSLRRQCNKLTLQKLKHLSSIDNLSKLALKPIDLMVRNFTGLRCRTNRTVNFYFLDNVYHSIFLDVLGVSSYSEPNKASVILVDLKDEAHYVLRETVDYQSLARFVVNYTHSSVIRHQRSAEVSSHSGCGPMSNHVCVSDVTTDTFQAVVMNSTQDVVLLYYTPWCGFCNQLSQVFLSTAQYFRGSGNITFARVNGDVNDLPWQFTVDVYPTILFFPAHRKSDSILYPPDVPKTVTNLIKFVLHHCNAGTQLDTAVSMCSSACVRRNTQLVLEKISELSALVAQLKRRATTLWAQAVGNETQRKLIAASTEALRQAHNIKLYKLKKAQRLGYFLQNDFKKLDKKSFMSFMKSYEELNV